MLPLTFLVWKKENIYLGMAAHMALNAIVWPITVGTTIASPHLRRPVATRLSRSEGGRHRTRRLH